MTQDKIIRSPLGRNQIIDLAREGKSVVEQVHAYVSRNNTDFTSESMAKMVCDFIAAEREACAKLCEQLGALNTATSQNIATSIRARGKK